MTGRAYRAKIALSLPESVAAVTISFTISAEQVGSGLVHEEFEHTFEKESSIWRSERLINVESLDDSKPLTVRLSGFVSSVKLKSGSVPSDSSNMLCAVLQKLDSKLGPELDSVCSNQFLLSKQFRLSLQRQVESMQGCAGLPGAISQEVPLHLVKQLMGRLPPVFDQHCAAVYETVLAAVQEAIAQAVPESRFPRLGNLFTRKARDLMAGQKAVMHRTLENILRWECTIHTSNHYYMSTVQSVRADLFAESSPILETGDETCPSEAAKSYVKFMGLSAAAVKAMSNQEQEVVDMQIKVFAYWKTMKKRLLDYVQLAARAELAAEPINSLLCIGLREALETEAAKKSMAAILSPTDDVARQRRECVVAILLVLAWT
eukprot:scaffold116289_cov31-Prasinocladus_malaysianus.AAC.2